MYALKLSLPSIEQIDESGLSPIQFRVYCRLLRLSVNGIVSVSADSIAKACGIAKITVLRALTQLEQLGMIEYDRTPGKRSVFYLIPFENWKPQKSNKVVQFTKDTSISELPVSEINQQQDSITPPIGGVIESATATAFEPVNESNQLTSDTTPVLNLDEKIETVRKLGYSCCTYTYGNSVLVRVNCKSFSLEEFLEKTLDSFKESIDSTEQGIRNCWQALAPAFAKMNRTNKSELIDNRKKLGMSLDYLPLQHC